MTVPQVIVALDGYNTLYDVRATVELLEDEEVIFKVGKESHYKFGQPLLKFLNDKGFKVFLDLKLHDIPNTVANTVKAIADSGVWMTNLHCTGGEKMMVAAVEANEGNDTLLTGVTILTSLNAAQLFRMNIHSSTEAMVRTLSSLAHEVGMDGVVCSPLEVERMRAKYGKTFLTVTPGVRWHDGASFSKLPEDTQDQNRVATPAYSKSVNTDYIVCGRQIVGSDDPRKTIQELNNFLAS